MGTEDAIEEIWEMFRETDRRFQETDRKFAETDRKLEQTMKAIGELGNRLGEFVEHSIKPALVRLFRERGIEVHEVYTDVEGERYGLAAQIDLLVVDRDVCVVVEAKSKLGVEDVDAHGERMEKFKRIFPRYADARAWGAVAAMLLPEEVARYAYRKGFYVIAPRGEDVAILNDQDFQPAEW
jgi:hypothetical protein